MSFTLFYIMYSLKIKIKTGKVWLNIFNNEFILQ